MLAFTPPVALSSDHRPTCAACTGSACRWSESEPCESPDMQDVLRRKAVEHALECGNPVRITSCSVLTVFPVSRD